MELILNLNMSQRKSASSFIKEACAEANLRQISPHLNSYPLETSGKITSNNNKNYLNNFIGDSILANDIPRAFSVTKTGEKHLLDLDETLVKKSSASTLFTLKSPRYFIPAMKQISEKSFSHVSLEEANKSSHKIFKKSKSAKRFTPHKFRMRCSPKNVDTNDFKTNQINTKNMIQLSRYRHQETQTNENACLNSGLLKPSEGIHFTPLTYGCNIPLEGPNTYEKILQRQRNNLNFATPKLLEPLKIYRRRDQNWERYSELRAIASALTLITVIFWLLLTYFDKIVLWDYFDILWNYSKWGLEKEKPKTRVELFVEFLQDLWS